jgi:hypothetical protein
MADSTVTRAVTTNVAPLPGAARRPRVRQQRERESRAELLRELQAQELRRTIAECEKEAYWQRHAERLYETNEGPGTYRYERLLAYRYGAALADWQAEAARVKLRKLEGTYTPDPTELVTEGRSPRASGSREQAAES